MKRLFVVFGAMLLTAGISQAQITSSAHDFSSGYTWNTTGQICVVCHTPHAAATTPKPLWNHDSTAETGYTYYGTTLLGTATATSLAGTSSKVCMSCHDGTVGLGNFGATTTNTDYVTGAALIGVSLADDHPIGVTYNGDVAHGLRATTAALGTGTIADVLEGGKVECSSCHNVHNEANLDKLLRADNGASALCLACHIK